MSFFGERTVVYHYEDDPVGPPTIPQGTIARFRTFFRPRVAIWVAEEAGSIRGFLALNGSYIDRLYVHPVHQGRGVGSALMAHAKACAPAGLQLHTLQQNQQARAFYKQRGFRAVHFGISPPPESAPDVEYHWTPTAAGVGHAAEQQG